MYTNQVMLPGSFAAEIVAIGRLLLTSTWLQVSFVSNFSVRAPIMMFLLIDGWESRVIISHTVSGAA